jgi:hypothetical protein
MTFSPVTVSCEDRFRSIRQRSYPTSSPGDMPPDAHRGEVGAAGNPIVRNAQAV